MADCVARLLRAAGCLVSLLFLDKETGRLRKAPSGSREVVFVRLPDVDQTILHWGKLGYDLHDRSEIDTAPLRGSRLPEIRIRLDFVKAIQRSEWSLLDSRLALGGYC